MKTDASPVPTDDSREVLAAVALLRDAGEAISFQVLRDLTELSPGRLADALARCSRRGEFDL